VRTMPTLLNALRSPNGAWDTDYTIVVATGGQRLQVRMGFKDVTAIMRPAAAALLFLLHSASAA
jgi:hypothetical protein